MVFKKLVQLVFHLDNYGYDCSKVPKGNLHFEGCDQIFVPALCINGCAIMEKPISR